MKRIQSRFLGILVIGLAIGLVAPYAFAEKLPVYKLATAKVDKTKGRDLFTKAMGGPPSTEENDRAVIHRSGKRVMEIDKRSGDIFMGDMEKMWNPKEKPNLLDQAKTKDVADRFLKDNQLTPTNDQRVRVSFSHNSETMAGPDGPGPIQKQLLDRQVNYKTEIMVKTPSGDRAIPVYGGGGKFKVAVGDRGAVIGYHGGWREISNVESEEEILPQVAAESEFKKRFAGQQVKNIKARLVYYSAPGFEEQNVLAPAWVVSGEVQFGQEMIPSREVVVPATKYGPAPEPPTAPPPPRNPNEPVPPPATSDGGKQAGLLGQPSLSDLFFPPAYADPPVNKCGTEWIGLSGGLGGSAGNKQGFVDQCRAAGWTVAFDYGDSWAWEKDWRVNNNSYVDAVDLVFYTGHANQNGWVLSAPDDTSLTNTEVGAGGADLYGNSNLEWLIIAACGPMQSTHFTTGTTNAFDRWRGIFDGLHVFMGYGSVTYDNTSEGRRFMELARAGYNVIDAWFRTAWEIQPGTNGYGAPNGPTIWATAMYAHNGDHCARNDHLWGMGSTCPDVVGATQQRYFMWSGC